MARADLFMTAAEFGRAGHKHLYREAFGFWHLVDYRQHHSRYRTDLHSG